MLLVPIQFIIGTQLFQCDTCIHSSIIEVSTDAYISAALLQKLIL